MDQQKDFFDTTPRLRLIDSEDLMELRFKRVDFIVNTLLKPGLTVLAGSPKVGKSWLVLYLCMCIAKGESFWDMSVRQGSVLYIALEDSRSRLQDRLLRFAEEGSKDLYLATNCRGLGEGFEQELTAFVKDHPDARLIVIDTFQKIRGAVSQMSYANDYAEVSYLKYLADKFSVCILLVHHTRKLGDGDAFNEISGTNGIAGSADTLMVLKKDKRASSEAALYCTGRDIEDREIKLNFSKDKFIWQVTKDSLTVTDPKLPDEMVKLIGFMRVKEKYEGDNTGFCTEFNRYTGLDMKPNKLKMLMNRHRHELEDHGVTYVSIRRNDRRLLLIVYSKQDDLTLQAPEKEPDDAGDLPFE